VGQIFNAVSQMQRYPLVFIDPEFPKTEDGITLIWKGPVQMEGRYLPKSPRQEHDSFHLRAKGSLEGVDWALTSGRSDDKAFLGGESAFNCGEALMRMELVAYELRKKIYAQGLLGFDYVFSAAWSSKWEVFYNGFGESFRSPLEGFLHRSAPFRGTWYLGNLTDWEIHPLLKLHWVSVLNLKDPSLLLHLALHYSLSESLDLMLGLFFNWGKGDSEFGGQIPLLAGKSIGQPDITYLGIRWYF